MIDDGNHGDEDDDDDDDGDDDDDEDVDDDDDEDDDDDADDDDQSDLQNWFMNVIASFSVLNFLYLLFLYPCTARLTDSHSRNIPTSLPTATADV